MTEDRIIAIASTRHWQEVGVCFGKWLEENLQKSGLHEAEGRSGGYAPPQLQFMVANKVAKGLQLAVRAKLAKGAYDDIWLELSGVIH